MIRYLFDLANAITIAGLISSTIAIGLVITGLSHFAIALGLFAMMADQLDGIVAKRSPGRDDFTKQMGKALDGFADIVYGAVLPAVIVFVVGNRSGVALTLSALVVLAGAVRLSYFSIVGLSNENSFTGVPLSYDLPIYAMLFLFAAATGFDVSTPLLITALLLTFLHIAPIQVPAPRGGYYAGVFLVSVVLSAALIVLGLAA